MSEIGLSIEEDPSPIQPGGTHLAEVVFLPVATALPEERRVVSLPLPHTSRQSPAEALARARMSAFSRSARFLAEAVLSGKIRKK